MGVTSTTWPEAWLEGDQRHYPVAQSLRLGRSHDAGVTLPSAAIARHHCELRRLPSGEVELEDLGSSNGTFVNGQRVHRRQLTDGDVLRLGDFTLTFRFRAPPARPVDELKELVAAAPNDRERWLVWADVLSERGEIRGERIVANGGPRSLGPALEALEANGSLRLEWQSGHVLSARFQDLSQEVFTQFLAHPLTELLAELQLPEVGRWLELLGMVRLPALRRLVLGPYFATHEFDAAKTALAHAHLQAPRLEHTDVIFFARAWLEDAQGQRTPLTEMPLTVDAFVIDWSGTGWAVQRLNATGPALFINGHSRWNHVLRPGDVVRMGAHLLTFCAE